MSRGAGCRSAARGGGDATTVTINVYGEGRSAARGGGGPDIGVAGEGVGAAVPHAGAADCASVEGIASRGRSAARGGGDLSWLDPS